MRVLTLTQPWATLVAIGAKKIETRSWSTAYRGPLAIHAAKGFPAGCRELVNDPYDIDLCKPFVTALRPHGYTSSTQLPLGAIVAVCELKAIARIDYFKADPDAIYQPEWEGPFLNFGIGGLPLPGEPELSFGDYSVGRYAWELVNIRALPEPIPAKGAQGLWEPDTLTEMAIVRQEIALL